jgi:hypothetical protein
MLPDGGTTEAGTMTSANADPAQAAAPDPAEPAESDPAAPVPVIGSPAREPLLPEQSGEDTDAAWGDYPESAADRLHRDRPPHWDDF